MNEEPRESENILIIGPPGTGKTTIAKEFMATMPGLFCSPAVRDRGLADVPMIKAEDIKSVVGRKEFFRVEPPVPPATWDAVLLRIYNEYTDGCVYYDDIGQLVSNNLQRSLRAIIGQVRHNCNDQVFSFWNPNDVPPFIYQMYPRIVLFRCGTVELRNKEKYCRYDEILAAMEWLNSLSDDYPYAFAYIVTHPKNPKSQEPFEKFLNVRK